MFPLEDNTSAPYLMSRQKRFLCHSTYSFLGKEATHILISLSAYYIPQSYVRLSFLNVIG